MRYMYYPPRYPASKLNRGGRALMWMNLFPQIFGELFLSVGWELVNDGCGLKDVPTDNICDVEAWRYWQLDLGIFHWLWDSNPRFESVVRHAKSCGKKILWVCHELDNFDEFDRAAIDHNRRLMREHADYICVLNTRHYERLAAERSNVFLVPHFMPYTMIRDYKEGFFYNNGNARHFSPRKFMPKTFCFYGLVKKEKAIPELLRAWADVRRDYPEWKLKLYSVCTGDQHHLEQEVRALLNEQSEWIEDGYELLPDQLGEFAILPHRVSNNSGVLHELVTFGCPPVSRRCEAFEKYSVYMHDDLRQLIRHSIENVAHLQTAVLERKRRLIEENIVAKKGIIDLAGRILLDVLAERDIAAAAPPRGAA